jgi:hypothetical protein
VTPFKPGDLARTNARAGFAQGQTVVVREALPGDRVRISYPGVTDLIVAGDNLRPLPALAAPEDGDTAQMAADSQTPERLTRDRRLALVELAKAYPHGLTDFELAARTGRKQTSIGKRRWELVDAGMAIDTDERRPSDTGALAKVWAITTFGLEQLQQGEAS